MAETTITLRESDGVLCTFPGGRVYVTYRRLGDVDVSLQEDFDITDGPFDRPGHNDQFVYFKNK